MSIKHTLNLYTHEGTTIRFDDAIPDVIVRNTDPYEEVALLRKIKNNEFEGGSEDLMNSTYINEIIDGNAYMEFKNSEPNPDIRAMIDFIGHDNRVSAALAVRYLSGCGLPEARNFVLEYLEELKPSTFKEAADELRQDFHEMKNPHTTLGEILEDHLKMHKA